MGAGQRRQRRCQLLIGAAHHLRSGQQRAAAAWGVLHTAGRARRLAAARSAASKRAGCLLQHSLAATGCTHHRRCMCQHRSRPDASRCSLCWSPPRPQVAAMSAQLVWELVKKNNAFIRKSVNHTVFSAEPGNVANKHRCGQCSLFLGREGARSCCLVAASAAACACCIWSPASISCASAWQPGAAYPAAYWKAAEAWAAAGRAVRASYGAYSGATRPLKWRWLGLAAWTAEGQDARSSMGAAEAMGACCRSGGSCLTQLTVEQAMAGLRLARAGSEASSGS